MLLIFVFFQSLCSSASPSFVSENFLGSELDRVLDKVVEDLISEAAAIVAVDSIIWMPRFIVKFGFWQCPVHRLLQYFHWPI